MTGPAKSSLLSRLGHDRGGASAIEFALVAAFLILPLVLGVYDFGTALYYWLQVGNAARAGAQYVNVNGYSSGYTTSGKTCTSGTTTFACAIQTATGLGSNVTVSVGGAYCGCQSGSTYYAKTFSPPCNSCSANYTSNCCPAGQTPLTMAQVNATYSYKPIFSYFGFGPSNGIPLSAQATAVIY
ncbi:MAG: TadE/TadG family type IV pilus assembly protein [Thiohalocapsa sp.]